MVSKTLYLTAKASIKCDYLAFFYQKKIARHTKEIKLRILGAGAA
jgi:hypothetical protein